MKRINKYIVAVLLTAGASAGMNAQEALRSAYFLEGYNYRHMLNPALAPERNYVSFPVLGNLSVGLNGNIGLDDFLFKNGNGQLTTFMSPKVGAGEFLKGLKDVNYMNGNFDVTLLSVGIKGFGGYNTVSLGVQATVGAAIPKDLFRFMKVGMDGDQSHYNFKDLQVDATSIAELAVGHSRKINDKLRVGAKVKFLFGLANLNAKIANMDIYMSDLKWEVQARGEMNIAAGKNLYIPTKRESGADYNSDNANQIDWDNVDYDGFNTSGFGLGLDFGASYQLLPNLELSASVTDIGFMTWNNVVKAVTPDTKWTFNGFRDVEMYDGQEGGTSLDDQWDTIGDDLEDCMNFQRESASESRTSGLGATVMVGGLYTTPFYSGLKGGLLLTQRINGKFSWTEARVSANLCPVKWFDLSANYALSSFGSTLGWVVNFHPKGLNFFVGSDYQFYKVTPQYVPVGKINANVTIGINITFGKRG